MPLRPYVYVVDITKRCSILHGRVYQSSNRRVTRESDLSVTQGNDRFNIMAKIAVRRIKKNVIILCTHLLIFKKGIIKFCHESLILPSLFFLSLSLFFSPSKRLLLSPELHFGKNAATFQFCFVVVCCPLLRCPFRCSRR